MRLAAYILCGEWPLVACAAEGWVDHDPEQLIEANQNLKDLPAAGVSRPWPMPPWPGQGMAPQTLERRLRLTWAVLRGKL